MLESFTFAVDAPDRTVEATTTTSAGVATAITYSTPFLGANGGGNGSIPYPQVTIQNASAGDDVQITSVTAAGFSVAVVNSGSIVSRTIAYRTQGW